MHRCLLLITCCLGVATCASLQTPRAGAVRYANGSVYPMLGLPRAFVVGQPLGQPQLISGARAAAFGKSGGIIANETGLTVVDPDGKVVSRYNGDGQGAVLAIQDEPFCAEAWLPAAQSVAIFLAGEWKTTVLTAPLPGTVISLRRVSKDTVHLLASEDAQIFEVTVGLASGNLLLQRLLPNAKLPATYLGDGLGAGLLYQDGDSLTFESAEVGRKTLPFHGRILAFEQMSADAVHATDANGSTHWMLELAHPSGLSIAQLPSPAPAVAGGTQ